MRKRKVLLADNETIFAAGVKALLEQHFDIVTVANDGKTLLQADELLKPDVVIANLSSPLLDGADVLSKLAGRLHRPKIISLTDATDPSSISGALDAGAAGYLLKTSAPSELLNAVEKVLSGVTYVSADLQVHLKRFHRNIDSSRRFLTRRETEVLRLIAKGMTSKEIADALTISVKTVDSHRSSISRNLHLHSIAELTRYAIEHGLK